MRAYAVASDSGSAPASTTASVLGSASPRAIRASSTATSTRPARSANDASRSRSSPACDAWSAASPGRCRACAIRVITSSKSLITVTLVPRSAIAWASRTTNSGCSPAPATGSTGQPRLGIERRSPLAWS